MTDTKRRIFEKEEKIIESLDRLGRLDEEREFGRTINFLNDILLDSTLDTEEIEKSYNFLRGIIKREYGRTKGFNSKEMKVWHLSIFSSLEVLRKNLSTVEFDNHEELVSHFREIIKEDFPNYLSYFSQEEGIRDLSRILDRKVVPIPQEKIVYEHPSRELVGEVTHEKGQVRTERSKGEEEIWDFETGVYTNRPITRRSG